MIIRKLLMASCVMVAVACFVVVVSAQARGGRMTAVVTYVGDGPDQGMYKWGTYVFRLSGEERVFGWDSSSPATEFVGSRKRVAWTPGAVWRIVYSPAIRDRDSDSADFHLWKATFLGRVNRGSREKK